MVLFMVWFLLFYGILDMALRGIILFALYDMYLYEYLYECKYMKWCIDKSLYKPKSKIGVNM